MSITRRVAALCVALFALLASLPAQAQSALSQDNDSISVATGLTYQLIAPADNGRLMVEIQNNNTSTDNCWINVDGIVVATNTTSTSVNNSKGVVVTAAKASVLLQPGQAYTRYFPHVPLGPIVATCTNSGDSLYVGIH